MAEPLEKITVNCKVCKKDTVHKLDEVRYSPFTIHVGIGKDIHGERIAPSYKCTVCNTYYKFIDRREKDLLPSYNRRKNK